MTRLNMMTCAAILVVACGGGEVPQQQESAPTASTPATATETQAQPQTGAVPKNFEVKVSGAEYVPASLTIPKGEPVRITFTRDEQPTCGDEVVFPSLDVRKKIAVNEPTVIEIPAQASAGELTFGCGMDLMMKGKVVVQ